MTRSALVATFWLVLLVPAESAAAACRVPAKAHLLLRSRAAIVYELERPEIAVEHVVRACYRRTGRITGLASWDEDQYSSRPVSHFRSAGRHLAFASRSVDRLGAVYLVASRYDLVKRRPRAPLEMVSLGPINAQEHRVAMVRLLLDARGRVAASARANGVGSVGVFDAGGGRRLDESSDLEPGSLTVNRGLVSWMSGYGRRTYRLR